ncbi:transcriptional regulator [Sphingomonas sp. CARO-RG-8B-R24-01]|uniref:helix-turn-helix transcriptional regulator n=1 Tax=Sphingomonas sp. CARO-RG-8B-R24-01 TaxID=2914831 RepID=UPI001F59354E|nr:transcriptional regulator [Sphingomonas sp. CARO-RG-8B-R24-01]
MTARVAIRSDHLQLYEAYNIHTPVSDRYLATFELDADGVLLGCNAVGQHMLDRGNILRGSLRERVAWASLDLAERMNAALNQRGGDVLLVSVMDTTGARHAILIARDTAMGTYRSSSRTKMVVRDLLAWAESEILVPSRVYLLTASETALAQSLVMGRSLTTHAQLRGSVVATVRKQLSAIFAKTGTSRQVELVATLLATAALHDPWATDTGQHAFLPEAASERGLIRRAGVRVSH